MKYQDLCIRLSEILRARGINTVYFEDVNLLNSEDVVYPAAVVQLARVEQEAQSDRYTIMLTVCQQRQDGHAKEECTSTIYLRSLTNFTSGIIDSYGRIEKFGYRSLYSGTVSDRIFRLDGKFRNGGGWAYHYYSGPLSILSENRWSQYFNQVEIHSYVAINKISPQNMTQLEYIEYLKDFNPILELTEPIYFRFNSNINAITNIRGITDILAEDEQIQINSCVTTPFHWKFRDECEGITAEINLSLFFDSRCN